MAYKPVSQIVSDNKDSEIPSSDAINDRIVAEIAAIPASASLTLDNLTAPTAVNQNLNMGTNQLRFNSANRTSSISLNALDDVATGITSSPVNDGATTLNTSASITDVLQIGDVIYLNGLSERAIVLTKPSSTQITVSPALGIGGNGDAREIFIEPQLLSAFNSTANVFGISKNGRLNGNQILFRRGGINHQILTNDVKTDLLFNAIFNNNQYVLQQGTSGNATRGVAARLEVSHYTGLYSNGAILFQYSDRLAPNENITWRTGMTLSLRNGGDTGQHSSLSIAGITVGRQNTTENNAQFVNGATDNFGNIGNPTANRFLQLHVGTKIGINLGYVAGSGLQSGLNSPPGSFYVRSNSAVAPGPEMINTAPDNSTTFQSWLAGGFNRGDWIRIYSDADSFGNPAYVSDYARLVNIGDFAYIYTVDTPVGNGIARGIEINRAVAIFADRDAKEGLTLDYAARVHVNIDKQDKDFRVYGQTDSNLLVTDASTDRVGIGTATPAEKLEVNGNIKATSGNVVIATAGNGLKVATGANAKMGTATFTNQSSFVVNTTAVSDNSLIFVTQQDGGFAFGISAKTAGTSFTITHPGGNITGTVAWLIIDPA